VQNTYKYNDITIITELHNRDVNLTFYISLTLRASGSFVVVPHDFAIYAQTCCTDSN